MEYEGPAGNYNHSVLLLHYRSFACADAGVEQELYAENVGMVQRISTTIAGPVTYDLVRASVGPLAISERPSVSFSLNLRQLADRVIANLHLDVSGGTPVRLVFPTSQEYEVVLRDSSGQQMWRWSDGYAFAQAVHEKIVARLTYSVDIPLMQNGRGLPEGTYTVEAWLTTNPRRFSSAAHLVVQSAAAQ